MSVMHFSKAELERYSRHLILPEFNIEGQRKLKEARVLVVGTGGLGAPLLLYLTAAGVGTIGLVDFDVIDETNLQRQVLFSTDDVGKSKVKTAQSKLSRLNPHVDFEVHEVRLDSSNAMEILGQYDIVADGTDNFPTRYLVNDACVLLGKTNVYASIFRFEGQVSVFNHLHADGSRGPNYRDIFPDPPPPGMVPSCAEGGVLGVLPGIVGSLQANEVIKVATGIGEPLSGRLLLVDAASAQIRTLNVKKDPANPVSGDKPVIDALIDYDEFCGINDPDMRNNALDVASITVHELHELMHSESKPGLIDVRESYEYEIANLGGILIPQNTVEEHLDLIPRKGEVVIYCRTGRRSAEVIRLLNRKHGFNNLKNLVGGITEWAKSIDNEMPTY